MIGQRRLVAVAVALVALVATPAAAAAAGEVRHVQVRSWDGTTLDGWLHFPAAPVERAPVVLVSSPYFGQTHPTGGPGNTGDRVEGNEWQAPIRRLTSEGYVVAMFSVRGTGNSGGCFDFFGPSEERDQPHLVRWLARQPWSNGRVGMIGLSYLAATAIEAAVQRPRALKTIAVTGVVTDWWVFNGSPQGAVGPAASGFAAAFVPGISLQPPIGEPKHSTLDHLPVVPERTCPEVARMYEAYTRDLGALPRAAAFYRAR